MNIEKTISEHAVSDILTPMLESQDRIVTEDVAALFDQATGLDTPPASGTVTTTIEESRNLISAIIRRAWTATLTMLGGASVIGYITAAYTYLRTRLQGNETYGIPDRRSEISASSPLAANLALLNDRKIGAGESDVPDGMSLLQLVLSRTSGITKLSDPYVWDVCYRDQLYALIAALPSLNDLSIRCKRLTGYSYAYNVWFPDTITKWNGSSDVFEMPDLERFEGSAYIGFPTLARNFKIWSFPKMKWSRTSFAHSYNSDDGFVVDWVEQVLAPNCDQLGEYASNVCLCNFTNMWKAVFGNFYVYSYGAGFLRNDPKLIHLEFGAGGVPQSYSLGLGQWNPSYILSDNPTGTDLIEEGSTAQNNLQQFLQNFRDYIANRLTDNGSGLTLTLSQAVFSEIWDSQGQPQVKGDGLDELRADIHRIIRTDKQWAVNKA